MKVSDLSAQVLRRRLREGSLLLDIKPFVARIRSDIARLADDLSLMYGDFDTVDEQAFADFHLDISHVSLAMRWLRPKARFRADGHESFLHLPVAQAFAMHEWSLNWFVTAHAHEFLVLHAAAVEKSGYVAILPAPPGSGKSTLCAGLVNAGWRLLSDELALFDPVAGLFYGMARPVSLKNQSIAVIRAFAPEAQMTAAVPDTSKGTLALMRPPTESVRRAHEPASPAWIVVPRYRSGSEATLLPMGKAECFMATAEQSFNFDIQGKAGFEALGSIVERSDCYSFEYERLSDAVAIFDQLAASKVRR